MVSIVTYFVVLLTVAAASLKHAGVALALLLCMFGFEQWAQSSHPFFSAYPPLTNFLVGGVAVLALVGSLVRHESPLKHFPRTAWLVILLFAYALISVVWSPVPEIGFALWAKQAPYLLTLILLAPLLITSTDGLRVGFTAFLILGAFLIAMLLFSSGWTYRGVELIGAGGRRFMGNPLAVAEMAGYIGLAALLLRFQRMRQFWTVFRWVLVAGCLILTVKSGSRGQFFLMLASALLVIPIGRRVEKFSHFAIAVVGAVFLIVLGYLTYDVFAPAGGARWETTKIEHDMFVRWSAVERLLAAWFSSPLTLIFGLGSSASYDPRIIGFYSHVVPLEILGELGVVGFTLFVVIIVRCIVGTIRCIRRVRDNPQQRGILATLSALFVFTFLLSFKQGSLLTSSYVFAFAILLDRYRSILIAETGDNMPARASSGAVPRYRAFPSTGKPIKQL